MKKEQLDVQWLTLILEAKNIGLSIEEIRSFLHGKSLDNKSPINS